MQYLGDLLYRQFPNSSSFFLPTEPPEMPGQWCLFLSVTEGMFMLTRTFLLLQEELVRSSAVEGRERFRLSGTDFL